MVSLLKLATVTEEGVRFLSPHDGTPMYSARATVEDQEYTNTVGLGFLPRNTLFPCRTR
jgi:hypothetical protein